MKRLKNFEEYTGVEYVAPTKEHPSYKEEEKKKKKKKKGKLDMIKVPPNHIKDVISFKRKG